MLNKQGDKLPWTTSHGPAWNSESMLSYRWKPNAVITSSKKMKQQLILGQTGEAYKPTQDCF